MSPSPRPLSVILAGGGTAGHVNPLLAVADALGRREPDSLVTVLGTREGLESRLIPQRGYPLVTVPKTPFPRRPGRAAVAFPGAFGRAVREAGQALAQVQADVVVGFGGYVATPAYLAARIARTPIVVHEQNARPGLANRLGARLGAVVATTFEQTSLPHAQVVGMPLRREISTLDRTALREEAMAYFGLSPARPTLLVTGGSLGAQRLNAAVAAAADDLAGAGVQVLHLTGAGKEVRVAGHETGRARYVAQAYTDRMDLAYAVADLAVCRAGAGTVCELAAVGLPAVYVPLPVGNGEQRLNASGVVRAGGGLLVQDAEVSHAWVTTVLLPLMQDASRLGRMSVSASRAGQRDADEAMVDLVLRATGRS
ncbi:MAG TPA: undecaprenyldiphospho-muramoylpentapeptide beta-N-acetylglucosaminyltransferase [Ornithinimicrobium sp.]|uniref:undecaprenyldiphospho-muramoylpentapeptide beta-N-acetylglucosaminyltransferase n=1 Tax=Ornithinimicrobium sp. TaxID=1977084 RepID=UPI002B459D71|nr:undecaprenyldiphospho-muramoylpentapeptide beta-N-acetylglucosaminyltransferase [Ornithinimicrobium sp.]HKJ11949.1 undecaprenyldiphospho-muramoylpentapeptide beta-N-acetylglucosaminyltransferase [Ornithinimicrobium sp.]